MQESPLRFQPNRVEGVDQVTEIAVYPDHLVLCSPHHNRSIPFLDMAEWPFPAPVWKRLFQWGHRPRFLPVGERDWFHPPSERFFRFFTDPSIVIFLPDEAEDTDYGQTLFRRIQDVMGEGGFHTWDLG